MGFLAIIYGNRLSTAPIALLMERISLRPGQFFRVLAHIDGALEIRRSRASRCVRIQLGREPSEPQDPSGRSDVEVPKSTPMISECSCSFLIVKFLDYRLDEEKLLIGLAPFIAGTGDNHR